MIDSDPERPLAVCHVGPHPARGGGISTVTASIVELQRRDPGLSIELFPTSVDGGRLAKAVAFLAALVRLSRRCRRAPAPLLHVHTSAGASFRRKRTVLHLARRHGLPCLLHVHSGKLRPWYEGSSARGRRAIRRGLDLSDHVVALTESWKRYLEPLTSRPISVIPNAVDPERFDVRRDYALGDEIRILLVGGADLAGKGAGEAIDAVARLKGEPLPAPLRLSVVGHGGPGERDRLARRAERRGLAAEVELSGWVEPEVTRRLLRECDLFVLPSHAEGLPVAMLEAMAAALPIVVTPVGGIPDVVRHGTNGWLVRPGDPEELARALLGLLRDESLRRRLGRAARSTVRDGFDIRLAVERLGSIYRELAGSGRRDRRR